VAVLLLVIAALLAAACTGSQPKGQVDSAAAVRPEPEPTTTTTVAPTTTTLAPPTYPLTGRPATDEGRPARAAMAVKVDNSAAARPQSGLVTADVIYEEFTEGITRFIVVYHSADADVVGPVRSVRPADPVVATPLGGVLAFSGGSPAAEALARETPLTLVTENDTAVMYRRPGRAAPHNLYTSTAGLYSRVPADAGPPPAFAAFLPGGQTFTGPEATPVTSMRVVPAPNVVADYDWDAESGTWLRSTDGRPHLTEEGRIAPTTVIVQFTPYVVFVDDQAVMYPEVVGSGDVWILAAGSLVRGAWSKASPDAVTTFTDTAGAPIALPPGQTWVHLIAPGSSVSTR
jgi:hypothetical protein